MLHLQDKIIQAYFKRLERSIVLNLDLNLFDQAILECENALFFLKQKRISSSLYKSQFAMIYSNMGIAYIAKFQDEIDPNNKEHFYNQAIKHIKKGVRIYRELKDTDNYVRLGYHLSHFNLMIDGNVTSWIKSNMRIAKKIKEDMSQNAQETYAQIMLDIIFQYCSSSALNDCGISYKTIKAYLKEVNDIWKKFHPNSLTRKFDIQKAYWLVELTHENNVNSLKKIVSELETLLVEYKKHVESDYRDGLFEKYAQDVQNTLGVLNYRIGAHYDSIWEYQNAIAFYKKSIEYYKDSAESLKKIAAFGSVAILNVYNNIAIVRFSLYKLDNNEEYISQNIKELDAVLKNFVQIMPNSLLIADTLKNLGRSHYFIKNYELVLVYYQNAESILDNHEDPYEKMENVYWLYKSYAELFETIKDYRKAAEYILKARDLLIDNDYEEDSLEVLELDEKLKILSK